MSFFGRLFGDLNKREVHGYKDLISAVNSYEESLAASTEEEIKTRFNNIRKEVASKAVGIISASQEILDAKERHSKTRHQLIALLNNYRGEVFAITREVSKRTLGMRHFDEQIIGGAVLHEGKIAEMQTGEGKTLVATLPLVLNAATGLGVHLVTVNDYLARRDAGWMAPVYDKLGLTVSVIGPQFSYVYDHSYKNEEIDERLEHLKPVSRAEAYLADITYGTNNEFGFDYLRDNMAVQASQVVQRPLHFAIVDEVDSILIDEARTPLIISSPTHKSADFYQQFAKIASRLKNETDYKVDEKMRTVALTESGTSKIEKELGVTNLYDPSTVSLVHFADCAIKAQAIYKKNRDYVVKDGEVVIIDEFTGRMLQGRRYSSGIHQAIEAKEGVAVQEEAATLATITFQNFFRIYTKLSGMTGTAITEAEEFSKIYNLEVISVPTHRERIRKDIGDVIYKTEKAKFDAIAQKVKELQEIGQPVLIGTVSIAKSEKLSRSLKVVGVKHAVLNAKQHQKEGEIVSQAGVIGSVTVATNMAGRGVDIVLGGTPPNSGSDVKSFKKWEELHQKVMDLGGLYVIGTERHESRRIDNQLRGRSGRQGDPGVSQFYISMEDDLMRIFGGDRMKNLMERLNVPDDMSINNKLLSQAIEQAQTRVEGHNFDTRKQLVEYDDVTNKQREAIYRRRNQILLSKYSKDNIGLSDEITSLFDDTQKEKYQSKAEKWPAEVRFQIEQSVYLRVIDVLWVEHLNNLEDLRESIGLRGYGQRDPIVEYKQECYNLYQDLNTSITNQLCEMLLNIEVNISQPVNEEPASKNLQYSDGNGDDIPDTLTTPALKIGRNDPCPCGAIDPKTGHVYKYKKCGLINAPYHKG